MSPGHRSAMASYCLNVASQTPTLGKRIRESLWFTILWLAGMSGLERIQHGHWDHSVGLAAGGAVCFLLSLLPAYLWPRGVQTLNFQIDDFGIRVFWNGENIRKVRSDHVRYVRERQGFRGPRLVVSEQSSLGKRLFSRNRVTLPQQLFKGTEYEEIKALALGWLEKSER
jgi:hypothetical protein